MIARLTGLLVEKQPPYVVIDVGGVGYQVEVPLGVFGELPELGEPVTLLTHMQVSQDHQTLYGFTAAGERALFLQLLKISGIGAKLALTILSGASGEDLARFVADGDAASLTRLPGIGRKTAERIIVELRDKLDQLPAALPGVGKAAADGAVGEASSALRALGYKPAEANRMVREAAEAGMDAETIIRRALQNAAKT
ncbi:MAG: Holliday junction branch migration protein RuvA [Xanthomonadales bacterium]|nr:Holliday junction branch migration protein RuvA [Xanthomonadales bacterium]NIN59541.1 Holliday junction branch migration protein RuvA [Xanthomonadales bacterium]NIN74907.1 Holliday junction branch migration protein RuvA [Xanthomonadales bacterium]NIO14049.1 Holliday junction branch migration protein RuvA [Xanthomonadales bacterium]NIP11934.1 Holliday junction branch migration protein RuvA [Xanthomonadales bacterium]